MLYHLECFFYCGNFYEIKLDIIVISICQSLYPRWGSGSLILDPEINVTKTLFSLQLGKGETGWGTFNPWSLLGFCSKLGTCRAVQGSSTGSSGPGLCMMGTVMAKRDDGTSTVMCSLHTPTYLDHTPTHAFLFANDGGSEKSSLSRLCCEKNWFDCTVHHRGLAVGGSWLAVWPCCPPGKHQAMCFSPLCC